MATQTISPNAYRRHWSSTLSPEWEEWSSAVSNSISLYTEEAFEKVVYRFDVSPMSGKRITEASLSLQCVDPSDQLIDVTASNVRAILYADDPTTSAQTPIASTTTHFQGYPNGTISVVFADLDINVSNSAFYLQIDGDLSGYSGRTLLGNFKALAIYFTYADQPGPGPSVDPPDVSIPVFTIATPQEVDPDYAADLADIWISGVSKAVVSAAVESEAEITSVSFTYSGHTEPVQMTLQGGFYVATTPTAVTQGMTFTVTANAGGLTGSSDPTTLNGVQAYSAPSVNVDDIFRCNWSGERADGGECYKLKISTNVSSLQDKNYQEQNGITVLEVGILNASGNVVHLHNLSNNNNWQGPFADLDDDDAIYTIVVRIKDKVGRESETRVSINGKLLDIVMYRDTEYNKTHLGVGMKPDVSKGNGNATIQLPVGAKIIVGGTDITDWLREQIGGTW